MTNVEPPTSYPEEEKRWVIYNKETTRLVGKTVLSRGFVNEVKYFKTEAAAKARLTKDGADKDLFKVAEVKDFCENIEKKVEKTNIMTGEKFMESVNTPPYCSPSSEAFWSM
tara:strand:+ start:87 stop:422 length:336 start_codon:yes stop_codon:yes gene_type:complete